METKYVYQGVDYLRLTAPDHAPYADWFGLLLPEFIEEQNKGRREHSRWILNYYGKVGEHCFIGKSDAGSMVQVSSALADTLFRPLSRAGGRCSRIDIQVTATPPEGPDEYIHSAYDALKSHQRARGRPQAIEIRDTNEGAKMVTVGSRQSEIYGRVYDKGRESKQEAYAGMVRFELECKEETARGLHSWLLEDITRVHTIKAVVANYFEKRGCSMFFDEWETKEAPVGVKRTRTDETKEAWLSTQVAPTFLALCNKGKVLEALRAILTGASQQNILDIQAVLDEMKGGC